MNDAVGVLMIDEPDALEPTFRAILEHEPNLRTIDEADLSRSPPATGALPAVALVFLKDAHGEAGIARIAGLKQRQPALRILAAFQALDAETLCALAAAGADAFVARCASPREVCGAILALAANKPVTADAGVQTILEGDGLTPREAEILRFLSAGFSNKEVARRLSLSVRTVETHRLNLRRKTRTGRLKDLVALARHLGLAPVLDVEPARRVLDEPAHRTRHASVEAMAQH